MAANNYFEDELLDLIFTNEAIANVGDASGLQPSSGAGSVQVSLHTGTLADTHTATTQDEAAYGDYARQTVARSTSGWTVASGTVDNDAAVEFPEASSGSETETDVGITLLATGDVLALFGALDASLAVSTGITPQFAAGELNISVT